MKKSIDYLENKLWFRILKSVYLLIFIFFIVMGIDMGYNAWPKTVNDFDKATIVCDSGEKWSHDRVMSKLGGPWKLHSSSYKQLCEEGVVYGYLGEDIKNKYKDFPENYKLVYEFKEVGGWADVFYVVRGLAVLLVILEIIKRVFYIIATKSLFPKRDGSLKKRGIEHLTNKAWYRFFQIIYFYLLVFWAFGSYLLYFGDGPGGAKILTDDTNNFFIQLKTVAWNIVWYVLIIEVIKRLFFYINLKTLFPKKTTGHIKKPIEYLKKKKWYIPLKIASPILLLPIYLISIAREIPFYVKPENFTSDERVAKGLMLFVNIVVFLIIFQIIRRSFYYVALGSLFPKKVGNNINQQQSVEVDVNE